MDRRNGGDPLAPPRPPKLLPRVHRPRAPEPMAMNETAAAAAAATSFSATAATTTPQCTNNLSSSISISNHSNNNHLSQQQLQQQQQQQRLLHSITAPTTTQQQQQQQQLSNNLIAAQRDQTDFDDYQIHHLTFLPQRPSSLSRNSSHVSSASATAASAITAANSFTRRRPPATTTSSTTTTTATPGSALPLLTITGNSGNNNNFLSHFQSIDSVQASTQQQQSQQPPASPVTLAQPRPESERLTNEYVDTPLRTAQQLQHATRAQHPAGQQDNGQTTTHHLLLLPQRELLRQHQQLQQQHNNQIHSASQRLATAAAGTAHAQTLAGIDGTDGFLHSHQHQQHHQHPHLPHNQQQQQHHPHTATTATAMAATATSAKCPPTLSDKFTPPPPPRIGTGTGPALAGTGFASAAAIQPITQPITKQPASSFKHQHHNSSGKDPHALDELLDLQQSHGNGGGGGGGIGGLGQLGTPIILGGDQALVNRIVCPSCGRCRCEQCQSPRPLPQTWVCNKSCLCSAESIIDYASCLCCAKALFYHCARDTDLDCDDGSGTPCVDNPCSCGPYKRAQRWCWLGTLSLVLPCLWCYWPMRGCVKICELCYGKFAKRGCRCQGGIGSTSSMSPIVPLGVNGSNNAMIISQTGMGGGGGGGNQGNGKSLECSAATRILRKGEKALLDSSPDY